MNKYKQYRVRNKKRIVTDFENGYRNSEDKKNAFNRSKPFIPHWIEYRLVDEFKIYFDPSLVPKPLNGEKLPALCCKCFYLPETPEIIAQAYMEHKRWEEINKIATMVIRVGEFYRNPLGIGTVQEKKDSYYTCKNLCRETGTCLDYDNRPEMCSSFTYKEEYCEHCSTKPFCNGCKDYLSDELVKSKEVAA